MQNGIALTHDLARPSACVVAALILTLTFTCVRRAYAVVVVPNHIEIGPVSVADLATSASVTVPTFSPATITGTVNTPLKRGAGFMHATFHTAGGGSPAQLSYVGINSVPGGSLAQGLTSTANAHLVIIGKAAGSPGGTHVALATGGAVSSVRVANNSGGPVSATLEMI